MLKWILRCLYMKHFLMKQLWEQTQDFHNPVVFPVFYTLDFPSLILDPFPQSRLLPARELKWLIALWINCVPERNRGRKKKKLAFVFWDRTSLWDKLGFWLHEELWDAKTTCLRCKMAVVWPRLRCLYSVFQIGSLRCISLLAHGSFRVCPEAPASCYGMDCGVCTDSWPSRIGWNSAYLTWCMLGSHSKSSMLIDPTKDSEPDLWVYCPKNRYLGECQGFL